MMTELPDELRQRDQWVAWTYEERDGERTKPPIAPFFGQRYAKSDDPDTWREYCQAVEYHEREDTDTEGVGFMLSEDGIVAGVDLDGCRHPETEEFEPWAESIIEDLDSYSEVSPSGTGARIFLLGALPDGRNKRRQERTLDMPEWVEEEKNAEVELYDDGRYLTFTGEHITGTPTEVKERVSALKQVHEEYVASDDAGNGGKDLDEFDAPDPDGSTEFTNEYGTSLETIRGRDDKLDQLLTQIKPGYQLQKDDNSPSGYDMATASKLWFWRFDERQISQILRTYRPRDKMQRDDYVTRTIKNAKGGERCDKPQADGGTATVDTKEGGLGVDEPVEINPDALLVEADKDPTIPIALGGEEEPTLRNLQASEAAHAAWCLLKRAGVDQELLGVESGPLYGYENGIWTRERGETLLRNHTLDALGPQWTVGIKENVGERVRKQREISADDLGAPDAKVATESGLLNLRNREVEPLKPEHHATVKLNTEVDKSADCPQFKEFINEVVTDGDRKKLQEYLGYCLWHHAQPYGKAMFLVGPTDSGKGALLRIMRKLLSGNAVASQTLDDLVNSRWGASSLYGSWVNIRNEVSPNDLKGVERFKELTGGGDEIDAEFKGQDKFEFVVHQKFIFAMNQMPSVDDADPAFWNRLLLVEFSHTIPDDEQDPDLDGKIVAEESEGVLNWMLVGLDRLLEQGTFTGERSEKAKRQVCNAFGGPLDRFFEEVVETTGDDYDMVVKSDLKDLATAFANSKDMEPTWSTLGTFTRKVSNYVGVGDMRTRNLGSDTNRERVYTGVKPDPDMIEELGVDVKYGNISSDSGQQYF